MGKDTGGYSSDVAKNESGEGNDINEKKKNTTLRIEKIKAIFAQRMMSIQEEHLKKHNKPLTAEEALQLTIDFFNQQGNGDVIRILQEMISNKKGRTFDDLTYNDIKDFSVSPYKTLEEAYTKKFYYQMNTANTFGMLTLYADTMGNSLQGVDIGTKSAWQKFLKDEKFPLTASNQIDSTVNYFALLQQLLDRYIQKYGQREGEKIKAFYDDFKETRLTNATILSHFKDKGIYDESFSAEQMILSGKKGVVQGTKKTNLQFREGVDNLMRSLLVEEIEDTITPSIHVIEEMMKEQKGVVSFMRQDGFTNQLLKEYPRRMFVKQDKEVQKLYGTYHRLAQNNNVITTSGIPENVEEQLKKRYRKRIQEKVKARSNNDETYMYFLVQRLQGIREGVILDPSFKQRVMNMYAARFAASLQNDAMKTLFAGMGISPENIKNISSFRESFFDSTKTDHILKIEKDGKIQEITLVMKKDISLHPGAESFEDLFQFSFQVDMEKSDDVFDALAYEQLIGMNKVKPIEQDKKPFYLQHGKKYEFDYTDESGKHKTGAGYVFLNLEEIPAGRGKKGVKQEIFIVDKDPTTTEGEIIAENIASMLFGPFEYSHFLQKAQFAPVDKESGHFVNVQFSPDTDISAQFFGHVQGAVLGSVLDKEQAPGEGASLPFEKKYIPTKALDAMIESSGDDSFAMHDNEDVELDEIGEQSFDDSEKFERMQNEFSRYYFAPEHEIPQSLKEELFQKRERAYAWVDKGIVYFNKTYFEKTYGIRITTEDTGDVKFKVNGKTLMERIKYLKVETEQSGDDTAYENARKFLKELRDLKRHEIAHRFFHFHSVEEVAVKNKNGEDVVLSQETLCRIAEGRFGKRGEYMINQDTGKEEYILNSTIEVEQDGTKYVFFRDELEEKIANTIRINSKRGDVDTEFKFSWLKRLDAKNLKEYESGMFESLLVAASAKAVEDLNDEAHSNHVIIDLDDYPSEKNIKDKLEEIKKGSVYQEKNGKMWSSKEMVLDGVRYRYRQKKDDEGNTIGEPGLRRILPKGNNQILLEPFNDKKFIADRTKALKDEPIIPGQRAPVDGNPTTEESVSKAEPSKEVDGKEQFNKEFDNFDGSGAMKPGTILFFQDADSDIPGYGNTWIKARIVNTTPDSDTFSFELLENSEKNFSQFSGRVLTQRKSPELLQKIKQLGRGKVVRMNPIPTQRDRIDYVRDDECTLPDSRRGGKVTKGFEKRYTEKNTEKVGAITHVGKLMQSFAGEKVQEPLYEVTRGQSSVTVKGNVSETKRGDATDITYREHTMSYESFTQFLNTKGLEPLAADEVKNHKAKTEPENPQEKPFSIRDMFKSFNTISQALKKFPEAFKYKREQDQKMQAGFLYAGIAKAIPAGLDFGLLQWDDVKNDAVSEVDSTVWEVIQEYKNRLSRSEGGKVHAGKVVELIDREVFQNHSNKMRFRLKAAGYLLYALENGGPYIRKLRQYSDKGMRVKAILGEEHQKKMLRERQKLIDEYKSKGSSDEVLQDRISKFELYYIKEKCTDHPFYGTKFGRAVDDHMNDMYQASQISSVKEGEENKVIYEAYQTLKAGINNNMPKLVLGALEAMEGMVEEKAHYLLFYKAVMMILISGIGHTFSQKYIVQFKNLVRRRGIPIGHFLGDPLHDHKVLTVVDYIATQGDKSDRLPSLRNAIQSKMPGRNPKETNAINYSESIGGNKKHSNIVDVVESRRTDNGFKIVDGLNYKNKRFLNYMADTMSEGSEQKQILDQYKTTGIFNTYKDFREASLGDGDSPFYAEGIFNIAPGTFESLMLDYNQDAGRFRYPQAKDMRNVFSATIDSFGTILSTTQNQGDKKEFVEFLLKRFEIYFGNKFKADNRDKFVKALKEGESGGKKALNLVRADVLRDAALNEEIQQLRREKEKAERQKNNQQKNNDQGKSSQEQTAENKEEAISSSKGFDPTAVAALKNYIDVMVKTYASLSST